MCFARKWRKIFDVFAVPTREITRLRDTFVSYIVCEMGIESTNIYWIPIWNVLSIDLLLKFVNPSLFYQATSR